MSSFGDKVLTFIAGGPSGIPAYTKENDAKIIAGWERIIADPKTSPSDVLKAQRMLAQYKGSIVDPAEGNAKLFVDTAKDEGKAIVRGTTEAAFSAFPWWIYALVGVMIAVYLDLRFRK